MTSNDWILPFDSAQAASPQSGVLVVGGKGTNLARMVQAGLPVPGGFLLTTQAYRDFLEVNNLEQRILEAIPAEGMGDLDALERASAQIRGMFKAGKVPGELAQAIWLSYRQLGCVPVAVRSSATAEDLPDMSFAGQQDTYLNVLGQQPLLTAVIDCWSSLWTARAIGYRARNGVSQSGAALAVVVQRMVESQVSGVLFTANPLSGMRGETVIDATFGLGEALVSGLVEPDHYEVDVSGRKILVKRLGAKALSIHGQEGGGTAEQTKARKERQALPDAQILALARLGQRVADFYGTPQDIEWAWADNQFYLLQARPVTSLFPTVEGMSSEPLQVLCSFGAVQGMLAPITPLGRDLLRLFFAIGGRLYGYRFDQDTQPVLASAGERLWINTTTLMRNSVGRAVMHGALGSVEPSIRQAVEDIWDDPRLQPERKGIRPRALLRIMRMAFPMLWNIARNLRSPNKRREQIIQRGEETLAELQARNAAIRGDARTRLKQQIDLLPGFFSDQIPGILIGFVSAVAAGMASFNLLRKLTLELPEDVAGKAQDGWPPLALEITRGMPYNTTTEMDLALWQMARAIRADTRLTAEFQAHDPQRLSQRYQSGEMPLEARQMVASFLERYGLRGLAEIDIGRARWVEEPLHIFEVLTGYLGIEDAHLAPDAVFERGALAAQAAVDRLVNGLRGTRHGWLKARLARLAASRERALLGARESPKFFAVRMIGTVRAALLETGAELVQAGDLDRPDDLFFLSIAEIGAFAAGDARDWRGLITLRRGAYEREMRRKQIPRLLLSDGRAYYEGMRTVKAGTAAEGESDSGEDGLSGSPVSPGSVEGRVRVVLDPRQAGLLPGEIMVCPGTDPSWTPLFLTAAGLVMEVGGMMTHGAVVAREYGIPAVVGVDQATVRLANGQRIRLDGFTGQIQRINEP